MYKIAAINDEVDTCSVCGKSGLKRVVWLYDTSKDEAPADALPVGRDCAAIMLGYGKRVNGSVAKKSINRAILDHYIDLFKAFIETPVDVQVTHKVHHGIFRDDELDHFYTVGEKTYRITDPEQPTQEFLRLYRRDFVYTLNQAWYHETGLATGFEHQLDFPADLRNAFPSIGNISSK